MSTLAHEIPVEFTRLPFLDADVTPVVGEDDLVFLVRNGKILRRVEDADEAQICRDWVRMHSDLVAKLARVNSRGVVAESDGSATDAAAASLLLRDYCDELPYHHPYFAFVTLEKREEGAYDRRCSYVESVNAADAPMRFSVGKGGCKLVPVPRAFIIYDCLEHATHAPRRPDQSGIWPRMFYPQLRDGDRLAESGYGYAGVVVGGESGEAGMRAYEAALVRLNGERAEVSPYSAWNTNVCPFHRLNGDGTADVSFRFEADRAPVTMRGPVHMLEPVRASLESRTELIALARRQVIARTGAASGYAEDSRIAPARAGRVATAFRPSAPAGNKANSPGVRAGF